MTTVMIKMDDEGAGGSHGDLSHWVYEFEYHLNTGFPFRVCQETVRRVTFLLRKLGPVTGQYRV
jgi:hypothetical protein